MLNYREFPEGKFVEVIIEDKIKSEEMEHMWAKLNDRIEEWGHVGVLKEVHNFPKVEFAALLTNMQNGIKNYSKFDRIAVVTDKDWIKNVSELFSKISSIKTAVFDLDEKDKARAWLMENQ